MIAGNRAALAGGLDQIVQVAHGADLIQGEHLDGEVAGDDENDDRVEVIREESDQSISVYIYIYISFQVNDTRCFDTTHKGIHSHTHGQEKGRRDDMHSGP